MVSAPSSPCCPSPLLPHCTYAAPLHSCLSGVWCAGVAAQLDRAGVWWVGGQVCATPPLLVPSPPLGAVRRCRSKAARSWPPPLLLPCTLANGRMGWVGGRVTGGPAGGTPARNACRSTPSLEGAGACLVLRTADKRPEIRAPCTVPRGRPHPPAWDPPIRATHCVSSGCLASCGGWVQLP